MVDNTQRAVSVYRHDPSIDVQTAIDGTPSTLSRDWESVKYKFSEMLIDDLGDGGAGGVDNYRVPQYNRHTTIN